MKRRFESVLVALLAAPSLLLASDWPEFRGPTGQGIANVKSLPATWDSVRNAVWKQPLPGNGWSSPVLFGDRLYLTTAVDGAAGGKLSLRVLCLDTHTGKTIWNTEVLTATAVKGHDKNSHASPTPIVEGNRLYVHFGQYGTAALDLRGKVLWKNTTLSYPPVHGNGGSPIIVGNKLIFSADGASNPFIVALDKSTGKVLWKQARETQASRKFSFSTPLAIDVGGKTQVISPASGAVIAYDPENGSEIWRVRYGQGYSVVPRPVYGHGLVFLSSGFDRPVMYAIRPDGKGDVTDTHVAWTSAKGAPNTPSPLLVGDELYFLSDAGLMSCVDAKTGKLHWQERVGRNYSASPLYAAGRIYVENEEGVATVLKPGKTFEVIANNELKERTLASWAVDEGVIYIRTDKHLYRIQEPTP